MYAIRYFDSAAEDLEALDPPVSKRLFKRIQSLAEHFDSITPERLEGEWKDKFKFRVGDYRVIYTASRTENYIGIHMVRHRREVYRRR